MKHTFFWISIFLTAATGCDGVSNVSGRVTSAQGEDVEGAEVVLLVTFKDGGHQESDKQLTGSNGKFSVGMRHAYRERTMHLTVNADGYLPYESDLDPNAPEHELLIKLDEVNSPE